MLNKTLQYSLISLLIYVVIALIVIQLNNYGIPEIIGFISAGLLALLNLLFTMVFIKRNIKKDYRMFIKGFGQSTFVRIVIIVAIFFTILLKLPLNHFVFGTAFLILYFLFQMIEIFILHNLKDTGFNNK